ncbi:hypothetical protein [Methylophilus aquaticus]|uniref:Uncharacterized protein n=1 Tax=Methylophilus aquaticus TaxID=1971610 RepID=A0ABT9JTK0_9PROT|nr:hypothetical protein [Methylophilus aquaticus]MDP8567861.1 hypothetical protein [Methylophilus aquaticus]
MSGHSVLVALRWPLGIWLLVTLLAVAGNVVALQRLLGTRQQLVQLNVHLLQQQAHTRQTQQHGQLYTFYQQRAQHWREIGLSATADPLAWQDATYQIQQVSRLPHVRYTLKSTLYDASQHWPAPRLPAPLGLQITPAVISSVGMHEAELLQWLQQLQEYYAEALIVRECTWILSDNQTAVESQCLLHWMHLPFDESTQSEAR